VPIVKPPTADIPDTKLAEPEKRYHSKIPQYLLDLDAPEESSRFARANAATSNLPTPPTLPMFLSKSILNGTTPMKDDSSVLIMPNHTVLNHLATSSIKDNILATSATTRYKQKVWATQEAIQESSLIPASSSQRSCTNLRRSTVRYTDASAQTGWYSILASASSSFGVLALRYDIDETYEYPGSQWKAIWDSMNRGQKSIIFMKCEVIYAAAWSLFETKIRHPSAIE
jgi:hypothetical protein